MKHLTKNTIFQVLWAGVIFISRLGFLPANVSPLGSYGFFGSSVVLFGGVVLLFDYLIGGFYLGNWVTYVGFAAYPVIGYLCQNKLRRKLIGLPVASLLFFLISNGGVWWYWYPHTWGDLLMCYSLALPFYQRTLLGDLVFGYGYLAYQSRDELVRKFVMTFATLKRQILLVE